MTVTCTFGGIQTYSPLSRVVPQAPCCIVIILGSGVSVGVFVGVKVMVGVNVIVGDGVIEGVNVIVAVLVIVAVYVAEGVAVGVLVSVGVLVAVGVDVGNNTLIIVGVEKIEILKQRTPITTPAISNTLLIRCFLD